MAVTISQNEGSARKCVQHRESEKNFSDIYEMEACLSGVIYLHNSHSGIFHYNEDSLRFVKFQLFTRPVHHAIQVHLSH
jgi:hypothetical protein